MLIFHRTPKSDVIAINTFKYKITVQPLALFALNIDVIDHYLLFMSQVHRGID